MNLFIFAIVISIALTGCATSYKREQYSGYKYFSGSSIKRYPNINHLPVETAIDTLITKRGDSVAVYALASGMNQFSGYQALYLTYDGKDSLWLPYSNLISKGTLECEDVGGKVVLPRALSDEAWSRATVFVNKYSDMRIQVASDNIIDTYNPTKVTDGGYTVTRRLDKDNVIIEIETKGAPNRSKCDAFSYIKYGE